MRGGHDKACLIALGWGVTSSGPSLNPVSAASKSKTNGYVQLHCKHIRISAEETQQLLCAL